MMAAELDGLCVIVPREFADARGAFSEMYNKAAFAELTGFEGAFIQDNQSRSRRGVVRGLHYQAEPRTQGKLIRAIHGAVFDVAVDIRRSSTTCGQWFGLELSADNRTQLWVPAGFAHGFMAVSDDAVVLYKTTAPYSPDHERTIRWDDPDIGIEWPIDQVDEVVVSDKDFAGVAFSSAELLS